LISSLVLGASEVMRGLGFLIMWMMNETIALERLLGRATLLYSLRTPALGVQRTREVAVAGFQVHHGLRAYVARRNKELGQVSIMFVCTKLRNEKI